eukprot:scaffold641_cov373-Pavlova_lutheri.AAC.13
MTFFHPRNHATAPSTSALRLTDIALVCTRGYARQSDDSDKTTTAAWKPCVMHERSTLSMETFEW